VGNATTTTPKAMRLVSACRIFSCSPAHGLEAKQPEVCMPTGVGVACNSNFLDLSLCLTIGLQLRMQGLNGTA
jgi:hypothetical protein